MGGRGVASTLEVHPQRKSLPLPLGRLESRRVGVPRADLGLAGKAPWDFQRGQEHDG